MTKHTPEPWYASHTLIPYGLGWKANIKCNDRDTVRDGVTCIAAIAIGANKKEASDNADRIAACVNALAGIPDPAEFVKAVRAAMLNARGRSRGSVYMINRDQFLSLKQALAAKAKPEQEQEQTQ